MKTTMLSVALAALIIPSTLHAEDAKPINPALLYWQAAALLPQVLGDDAKLLREMASGQRAYDTSKAHDLLADESCLRIMQKAANSTAPCDWGLPYEDGPEMALPHVSKMMQMGGEAILHAEGLFAANKTREGLDWLLMTHRMARHVGASSVLVSTLVAFTMETDALRCAARYCLDWDQATRQSYVAMLHSLPPLPTVQAGFRGERIFVDWLDRKFGTADADMQELERFVSMTQGEKPTDKNVLAAEFTPGSVQGVVVEMRALNERAEAALGQPWPQCQADMNAVEQAAAQSTHYLVRDFFPTISVVAEKQFALATLHTMLEAALQHGAQLDAAAAAASHDSFDGEPLQLRKDDDSVLTFVSSHHLANGKEVSLRLGR